MRKIIFSFKVAMIALVIVALFIGVRSAKANSPSCQSRIIMHAVSKDGKWDAIAYEGYCTGDYSFDSTDATHVIIQAVNQPSTYSEVFETDGRYTASVSWLSNNKLQITSKKSLYIGVQNTTFSGINISYVLQ